MVMLGMLWPWFQLSVVLYKKGCVCVVYLQGPSSTGAPVANAVW